VIPLTLGTHDFLGGAMLQLRLLGHFEFRRDDGSSLPLPGRQSMAILSCLALADYFIVERERLAELIWAGRGTEQANGSLRQELVRLRRAIARRSYRPPGLPRSRFVSI